MVRHITGIVQQKREPVPFGIPTVYDQYAVVSENLVINPSDTVVHSFFQAAHSFGITGGRWGLTIAPINGTIEINAVKRAFAHVFPFEMGFVIA